MKHKFLKFISVFLLLMSSLTAWSATTSYTIYFCPGAAGKSWTTPYVNCNKGWDDWQNYSMSKSSFTFHGYDVYQATIVTHDGGSGFDEVCFHPSQNDYTTELKAPTGWPFSYGGKIYDGSNWQNKAEDSEQTFYFCPKCAGKDWTTPYANCNLGYNHWSNVQMTEVSGKTFCGQKVYQATVTTCAFDKIQFHKSKEEYGDDMIDLANPSGVNGKLYNGSEWKTFSYDTEYTFYFASDWNVVYVNCNLGYNIWKDLAMTNTGKTYNGKKIYSITVAAQGFNDIEFHKSHGGDWDTKVVGYSNSTTYKKDFTNALCTSANNWVAYNYDVTLTFDPKNGGATTNKVTLKGGSITAPSAPSKTGYTFQGWGTSKVAAGGTISNVQADATYDAQWTANTNTPYTVKHYKQNLDGTYPSTATETEDKTGTTDASVTPPTKSYTGFTAPSTQTETIAADGSLVVEYYYTRNSHTLTWNANGGTIDGEPTKVETLKYDAAITVPQTSSLSYSGHNFTGWNTTPASTMPDNDVTYTAQWEVAATATVTYDGNGNTGGTVPTDATTYAPGATVTVLTGTPEKTGYNFKGWKNSDGGAILSAGNQFTISSSVTLTAQWEIVNYSITYTGVEASEHTNPATYTVEDNVTFTAPSSREGYTFAGWTPTSITKGTTGDKTVTGSWTLNHHTLTWVLDGGTITTAGTPDGQVDYGTPLQAPVVAKDGYTFAGWSPEVAATMPDNDVTYTAQWIEVKSTLTADVNDIGTAAGYKVTGANAIGVVSTAILTASAAGTGYTFEGWTLTNCTRTSGAEKSTTITVKGTGNGEAATATANYAEDLNTGWRINLGYDGMAQWFTNDFVKKSGESTASVGYLELELQENYEYKFKVVNKLPNKWYGNTGTMTQDNCTNWTFYEKNYTEDMGDAHIQCSAAGKYIFKVDYSGSDPVVSVTYPAAQTFAVTISTDDNGSVEPNGEQQVDAFTGITVTATPNPGYHFTGWVKSTGITVTNETATTTVKASQAGTLQATFAKNTPLYFKNGISATWSPEHMYIYLYKDNTYWDGTYGTGSNTSDYSGSCIAGPIEMTRIPHTDIWEYDYDPALSFNTVVFSDQNQEGYNWFANCTAVRRADFNNCMNMFVLNDATEEWHNQNTARYFNKGFWRKYNDTKSGFYLHVFQNGSQTTEVEMVASAAGNETFEGTVELQGNAQYPYNFYLGGCNNTNWSNHVEITPENCTGIHYVQYESVDDKTQCTWMTPTSGGKYKFALTYSDDNKMLISVEYPILADDYRVKIGTPARYSNIIRTTNESGTISLWLPGGASNLTYQKATIPEGKVVWVDDNTKSAINVTVEHAGVYTMTLTKSGTIDAGSVKPYKGNYYIRTDCAQGGWQEYKTNDNNLMRFTDRNPKFVNNPSEGFNYYYCRWNTNEGGNVRFVVANEINACISDTMKADTWLDDTEFLKGMANIRFGWNSNTNELSRAYISGSYDDPEYLRILSSDNKLFEYPKAGEGSYTKITAQKFADENDWTYTMDVYADGRAQDDEQGANVAVSAKYNNKYQSFVGSVAQEEGTIISTEQLLKQGTKQHLRLVYDFKTDRLISGWTPEGNIDETIVLDADMLLVRQAQGSADQIRITSTGVEIQEIKTIYAVLQLNKDIMTDGDTQGDSIYARNIYWFSLPFDVKVNDIFGVDGYGTKWVLQYYDGDLRSKIGFFKETETFWTYLGINDMIRANVGYALCLDPDFFDDEDDAIWANGRQSVSFYFPSADRDLKIVGNGAKTVPVPEHKCTIDRTFADGKNHKDTDTDWNVIGSPAFQNLTGTSEMCTMKALYQWRPATNDYLVAALQGFNFQTTHSYLVQFHGDINWQEASVINPTAAAPRYAYADEKNYTVELQFYYGSQWDRTYVALVDNAKADFVLNEDLTKMTNSGQPNIYSYAGAYDVAYNATAFENQTVNLGVIARKNGSYTFAMPKDFSGKAVLVDLESGEATDLNLSDYTVELNKGTYNNRFQLLLEVEAKAPTNMNPTKGEWSEDGKTKKLFINDNIYLINAGRVYNASGTKVR